MHWSLDTNIKLFLHIHHLGILKDICLECLNWFSSWDHCTATSKKMVKLIKVVDGLHFPTYNRAVWNIFLYFVILSFKHNNSLCIIWLSIQSKSLFSPHFLSAFYSNTEKQWFILTLELRSVLHLQSKKTQCGAKCPAQLKRYKLKKKKKIANF